MRHHRRHSMTLPWFAHETARRLEALAHIQLEIDQRNLLPKRWFIAPSTIVESELGPCFLAGSRSARLLRAIAEVAAILEGEVRVVPQPDGPSVVEIHGLGTDELTLLVEEVNDRNHLKLALSIRPASRIAAMLPSLGTIRGSLPELTTTAARLERLDLSSGRWIYADQMDLAGAYRLRNRPWIYAVVPKPGARERRSVVADVRLAKHLAASDATFALIGYDKASRTLLASRRRAAARIARARRGSMQRPPSNSVAGQDTRLRARSRLRSRRRFGQHPTIATDRFQIPTIDEHR